jgi:DNA/RNA endonuclease G (NUC1)
MIKKMCSFILLLLLSISAMAFGGCPEVLGQSGITPTMSKTDLCYSNFGVRYSTEFNGPLFSVMVLNPSEQNKTPRSSSWKQDYRLPVQPNFQNYPHYSDKVEYDRGHLTPADLMYSEETMRESFTLTNQAPQVACGNRGKWKAYESNTLAYVMRTNQPATIVTGVIYDKPDVEHKPSIPVAYYKVVYAGNKKFAFYLPNTVEACQDKSFIKKTPEELEKFFK